MPVCWERQCCYRRNWVRKDFYLFRHGETEYNRQRRWQGQGIDVYLNDSGVAQAQVLADKLQDKHIEIIYSSPLKRAVQTAQIVAKSGNIPVKVIDDLTEGSVGVCEGALREDVEKKYPEIWNIWYGDNDIMDIRWPEGESKLEVQQRMVKAFDFMLETPEKVIGVASHGAAMRYFLLKFGYGPHKMENTALFHLVYEDGKWSLIDSNL